MIPPRPREIARGGMPGGWWSHRSTPLVRRMRAMVLAQLHPVAPYVRALRCGRDLVQTAGDETGWPARAAVACVTFRGEALLDAFLAHHRGLGIGRFAFLDLSAEGALGERLADAPDCVVWRPRPGRPAREQSWANFLRFRHAADRWCVSVEAGDFLVFWRCETRSLLSLTDFLETEHRDHAWGLMVDLYGAPPAGGLGTAGDGREASAAAAPYFDPIGYQTSEPAEDGTTGVRGGVLRRTMFRTVPRHAPRLDCIPLVRWRRPFSYVDGTTSLQPSRLNRAHSPWHGSPTVCLLRFGLLGHGDLPARWRTLRGQDLRTDASRPYRSSDDLVDCGMLNPGQWF